MKAKYLRMTICDNDYILSLKAVGELLYKSFVLYDNYPKEKHLSNLQETIKYLLYGEYSTLSLICKDKISNTDINYFTPKLDIVEYLTIPDWENGEVVYIPLFNNSEILVR